MSVYRIPFYGAIVAHFQHNRALKEHSDALERFRQRQCSYEETWRFYERTTVAHEHVMTATAWTIATCGVLIVALQFWKVLSR